MHLLVIQLFLVISIMLSVATHLFADEIFLKNGDRISGKAIRMEEGKLTVKTGYAEEVRIDWNQVVLMEADAPLHVVFLDGTSIKARVLFYREQAGEELPGEGDILVEKIDAAKVVSFSAKPKPPIKLTARLNAGLSNERGNTDTDAYNINTDFIARTKKHRFSFYGELSNQKAGGVNTAENWRALGTYDYFFAPKWFLSLNALFENNRFADLNLRTTLGAGAGYQIFEADALNLSITFGPSYVKEDFVVAEDDTFYAGQWTLNYDQAFLDKLFQLFHSNLATLGFRNADNWRIRTRQGFRFFLYKGLTTTFQYNYDYNNNPSTDADTKWDSKILILLGYEFKN